ncbi:MAG: hypothetical protein CMA13_01010 [Euryarchaeota archaeon]|nr:hypothetical protein [Euryarchaeota archaeon]OUV27222.1 MAG: hypothetical protein CBC57_01285 [Euryarchaeota archaeon TMED97]
MSKKIFVKIVTDPEVDLRKCVVGLACASQAVKDGHDVSVFFAANGVKMLNSRYLKSINQMEVLPNNMIFDILNSVTQGATNVYCSTGSQAANGVTSENAGEKLLEGWDEWMTWSGPPGVIELSVASEVQLIY